MEIWINPECSKCHAAVAALEEAQVTYTVRRYLEDPPTVAEIEEVLERLGLDPWHIVRLNESIAGELGLAELARDDSTKKAWIQAMAEHPILIQRPIITTEDNSASIVRSAPALAEVVATATAYRS